MDDLRPRGKALRYHAALQCVFEPIAGQSKLEGLYCLLAEYLGTLEYLQIMALGMIVSLATNGSKLELQC